MRRSIRHLSLAAASLLVLASGCGDSSSSSEPETDTGTPVNDTGSVTDTGTLPGTDTSTSSDSDTGTLPPGVLPSGDSGIAAKYPGDLGIKGDKDVIFADDFESYTDASGLGVNWDVAFNNRSIAKTPTSVFRGKQSLEFFSPKQTAELSNGVAKTLTDEQDVLFLRWYSKFDSAFDVVGSSHNGGGINAHYFKPDGSATPGIPADGKNKFLVEFECWRGDVSEPNPGNLNAYVYHPEQRSAYGDHFFPDGKVLPNTSIPGNFGPEFVARPNVVPELNRWYAYEVMLRANTPGIRDGRIAFWLDGKIIADFRNLRLRDIATLKINRFGLSLHIGSNTRSETRKWYDNVVAAKSYIGPVFGP